MPNHHFPCNFKQSLVKLLRDVFLALYEPHQMMEVALQLLTIDTTLSLFLEVGGSFEEIGLNIADVEHVLHEVRRKAYVVVSEGFFLPPHVAEHHLCLVCDVFAVRLLDLVKVEI